MNINIPKELLEELLEAGSEMNTWLQTNYKGQEEARDRWYMAEERLLDYMENFPIENDLIGEKTDTLLNNSNFTILPYITIKGKHFVEVSQAIITPKTGKVYFHSHVLIPQHLIYSVAEAILKSNDTFGGAYND